MTIASGTKLGPYEVLEPIGAGGMGEVYKATDTRLDRTVAIKVLPSHVSGNPQVRERFEREARTISQLNHPHICTLHDVGRENGVDFLVMEHIEGETLAERLGKGALPLEQALQYGIEIADALDKAHRQGVVHRDLKPGNIMLTKSGAKLLDFGLAKTGVAGSGPDLSGVATEAQPLTAQGAILGTFQYMAPEQLEGKEADARTDIFAFGAVLYEMLTGQRAFHGKSQASLIGSILKDEPPPVSTVQTMTPPTLDHVIRRCMAKEPEDRWQAASDVMRELKWVSGEGSSTAVLPTGRTQSRLVPGIAIGLAAGALVASLAVWALMRPAPEPTRRLSMTLPADAPMLDPSWGHIAMSPDGTRLAYVASTDEETRLYIRSLNQLAVTPMPGTKNARRPFFSPDGEWVGFFENPGGKLKKVPVDGGPAMTLCESPTVGGASWSTDDRIFFAHVPAAGAGLFQVPAAGGVPEALTVPDPSKGEATHISPEVLPNGKTVLFSIATTAGAAPNRIAALSLDSGEYHTVLEGGYSPRYSRSGHLIYLAGETLTAAPFDVQNLKTTGPPAPVLEGIGSASAWGVGSFGLSRDGSLAYVPGGGMHARLVWVDRLGREVGTLFEEPLENPRGIRMSPDGRRVTVVTGLDDAARGDLWIYYLDNRPPTRLTFDGSNQRPVWIRDGTRLAFSSTRTGSLDLFSIPADGSSSEPVSLFADQYPKHASAWSPLNGDLLFDYVLPETISDIFAISIEGEPEPSAVVQEKSIEGLSSLSSDGRWLAYVSNGSGGFEVMVRPYPGPGPATRVSRNGGEEPVWGPRDEELYYRSLSGERMMAVEVSTEPTFRFEAPKTLFEGRYLSQGIPTYDVAPDGRFVMAKPTGGEEFGRELVIVLNWFEELERRVPTK